MAGDQRRSEPLPLVGRGWGGVFGKGWRRAQKNPPKIFPTLSPHAILASPSVPTDGRGTRSPRRREAVSSGLRGPYLRAGSLRRVHPGQRGDLPDRGGSGKGCRANGRNRVQEVHRAPFAREAGGRHGLHPAAFDPHPCPGGLPGHRKRRHRKRRPGKSLPRLTHAGGRGRCSVPEGSNATQPPGLASRLAGRRARPRPEGVGQFLTGGARATAPSPLLMPPRARGPRPASPDCART